MEEKKIPSTEEEYVAILKEMTLEEKMTLISGKNFWETPEIERLNIPSVWVSDGPNGLRKEKVNENGKTNVMQIPETATCFPPSVTVASSWDVGLAEEIGNAIAEEAHALGVTTVLGPGVNIKRNPLCGRNFEYYSEDPYLAGKMGKGFVHGVQKNNIGVSLKHFAANNQEYLRMSINTLVDERTLREIYLTAFEDVVKSEQPTTIMSSYNRVNNVYASENKKLLTDILRDEWGFKGIVVSDWGAINERVASIKAGNDLEMPGNKWMNNKYIREALENGSLTEEELDKIVLRMIRFVFESKKNETKTGEMKFDEHHALVRKAAAEGAILFKNDGILPLKGDEKIAVVGRLASELRYQGAGSSHIGPPKVVSLLNALDENNQKYEYAPGYTMKKDGFEKGLIEEAVNVAKDKDVVIACIGLTDAFESEGFDRDHLNIPKAHVELVNEIAKVNKNIVVVLSLGSPIIMHEWKDNARAILNSYLGGQAGGEAMYDLLYGKVNPCGKLAETFPKKLEDIPSTKWFKMGPKVVEYREGLFVGYRYFDTVNKEVEYPFGYGLSYTKFEYSDIKVSKDDIKDDEEITVSFKIKNVGEYAGKEIAQVYVKQNDSKVFKANKELKGFTKVFLEKGEEKEVTITLNSRSFAYYNTKVNDWYVESGNYTILVGAASNDIKLQADIKITASKEVEEPNYSETAPTYCKIASGTEVEDISKEEYQTLLGFEIPENDEYKKGTLNKNCSVGQMRACGIGKFMYGILTFGAKIVASGSENPEMITKSIVDMPYRSFSGFTGGLLSPMTIDGLVDMCNGTKGGFKKFCAGFKKKNKQ
ncbi:MAG: glycoside hydrolase family 3 C-terminal domain-containing protein [Clostridia bacterium]|nr:glycoside hydrolase family 3 C-terminal domain-containing protein [Clostridia bacterium]